MNVEQHDRKGTSQSQSVKILFVFSLSFFFWCFFRFGRSASLTLNFHELRVFGLFRKVDFSSAYILATKHIARLESDLVNKRLHPIDNIAPIKCCASKKQNTLMCGCAYS